MQHTFLITGASKGIGLALTQMLSVRGHNVVGIARGATADFPGALYPLDLSDGTALGALPEIAGRHAVDGIVNNDGLVRPQPLGSVEVAELEEVMRVNLHPALVATQAALPRMRVRGCACCNQAHLELHESSGRGAQRQFHEGYGMYAAGQAQGGRVTRLHRC